jgi:hypothetical protein
MAYLARFLLKLNECTTIALLDFRQQGTHLVEAQMLGWTSLEGRY